MTQETIFVKDATTIKPIQQIEQSLTQLKGIERVLVDTADGEVKIEFDSDKITREQIVQTLQRLE
ncbi:heavy-metal-associated domain-containing protein [Alkalihalobacillus deserti]|uniref:heavy-metal-associated domain-containing protein n=1 Tax=Alkalihalobacillus deserti TaxID=2879466 RepID=UPI001D135982|nr:cation transporter [Alkalihalobacillus deserti]